MREGRTARRERQAPRVRPTGAAVGVVVVGSINIDMVVRAERLPAAGETVSGGAFERHGGGKGANAAVAAARAGAAVSLIAAVGEDDDGSSQLRELAADGVDVSGVIRLAGEQTGRALVVVADSGENQIAVAAGANAMLDGPGVLEALKAVTLAPGAVCLLGFEVGDAALQVATRWAVDHGARVVLNPAPARAITESVLASQPILTPNEGEALSLAGGTNVEEAARSLAGRTGAPVVVTLGAHGVLIAKAGRATYRLAAPPVDAMDTTGAGDAFNGALAARLSLGDSLDAAATWATAAAAIKVTRRGARSSPTATQVARWLAARRRAGHGKLDARRVPGGLD